jgi:hypothetical protein
MKWSASQAHTQKIQPEAAQGSEERGTFQSLEAPGLHQLARAGAHEGQDLRGRRATSQHCWHVQSLRPYLPGDVPRSCWQHPYHVQVSPAHGQCLQGGIGSLEGLERRDPP